MSAARGRSEGALGPLGGAAHSAGGTTMSVARGRSEGARNSLGESSAARRAGR